MSSVRCVQMLRSSFLDCDSVRSLSEVLNKARSRLMCSDVGVVAGSKGVSSIELIQNACTTCCCSLHPPLFSPTPCHDMRQYSEADQLDSRDNVFLYLPVLLIYYVFLCCSCVLVCLFICLSVCFFIVGVVMVLTEILISFIHCLGEG